jgi:hypothetical protein
MEAFGMFMLFAAIAIVLIVLAQLAAVKRRKELQDVARRVGMEFVADCDNAHSSYLGFEPFGRGRSNKSSNLIHGRRGEIEFELFDYTFKTGSGKNRKTHNYGIAAAKVPMHFRQLVMRPESIFDKVAAMAGFDDINFESEQFSRRFHVRSPDRKFAYDVIDPRMMEFLLSTNPPVIDIEFGRCCITDGTRCWAPEEFRSRLAWLYEFFGRWPQHVKTTLDGPVPGPTGRSR